jgi:hypothetical protein
MGNTIPRRMIVALFVVVGCLLAVGPASARPTIRVTHSARPSLCLRAHHGAFAFCQAAEHRKALRIIRHRQVHQLARTHARFHRSYYRGWDLRRLRAANHWERRRLRVLQSMPTWYPSDPVALGRVLAAEEGWTGGEFQCLYLLWNRESGWSTPDTNSSSGAAGIPQALPPSKMGAGWDETEGGRPTLRALKLQIRWGIGYIKARYGSACAAWAHSNAYNYY